MVMNFSISCSKFSTAWKLANICPIFKSGKRENRSNYWPISILNVLSKILEKHVHIHLYQFLTTYNLLHLAQSGFRKLHSCETALAKLASKFAHNMNKGEITGIILLNLHKAFDMVDHKHLLKELALYQLSNDAVNWFEFYLTNRKQVVKVKSTWCVWVSLCSIRCSSGLHFRPPSLYHLHEWFGSGNREHRAWYVCRR